jgi:hypothetical protein
VILVLSNNVLTDFLKDSRRINVACSRAQQRLYIVGDLSTFSVPEAGVWQKIAAYATSDYKPALEMPDMVEDFPTLGAQPVSGTTSSAAPAKAQTSLWASATKPIIKAAAAKPTPTRTLPSATVVSSPQDYVATVLRTPTAPSTPQVAAQVTPSAGAPAVNLMSRLSNAAMAASPPPSASLTPTFTPSRSLTSKAAPFVPSKSAMEFVPGAAFRMAASTPPAAASSTAASKGTLFSADNGSAVASSETKVSARTSSPVTVAASSPALAPSVSPAAIVAPAGVPSIHAAGSFPAMSTAAVPSVLPSPTRASPAPLSFAARVAAAAASSAPAANTAMLPPSSATAAVPSASYATPLKSFAATSSVRASAVSSVAAPTRASPAASPTHAQAGSRSNTGTPVWPLPSATVAASPAKGGSTVLMTGSALKKKVAPGSTEWNCSACSFHNLNATRFCEMCETQRAE